VDRTNKDVDAFLRGLPGEQGEEMRVLDKAIAQRMPDRPRRLYEGKFWGGTEQRIIGYGDLDYTGSKGEVTEWFVVGLAAQKNHISVYVSATDDDGYLVAKYAHRLGKAKVGSAVVTFKSLAGVDLESLLELVTAAANS
jgi:hypothetical protein